MSADVVPLRTGQPIDADSPVLLDVAQCLRNIVEGIEQGEYGTVVRAALVLRSAGREPDVFGPGDTTVAQTYMDLHAGAQQIMNMPSPERA